MPLEAICAGFARTGTSSLKEALEKLGFGPTHHMAEVLRHGNTHAHMEEWIDALEGKAVDWQEVFKGYKSSCDFPSCLFYSELLLVFPSAKVILTARDPESWYESVLTTIYSVSNAWHCKVISLVDRPFRQMQNLSNHYWRGMPFHGKFLEKQATMNTYLAWNENVRKSVRADKLLVYDVKEGWEPLCRFLGVQVPDTPFPFVNDVKMFEARAEQNRARAMAILAKFGLALLLLIALLCAVLMGL